MRARGEADPPARCRTALGSPVLSVLLLLVLAARRPERRAGDMPSVYGQKYVWLVEDAEGQSHDREGTSDTRRVMFRESIETEHGEKKAGDHLTWGEVIDLWIDDRDFRAAWMASFEDFRDVNWGTGDYYWECAPVKSASLGARYEHVVKDKGARRGGAADEGAFAEHFDAARNAGKIVATFRNLGGDAKLVSPLPDALNHRRRGRCMHDFISGWGGFEGDEGDDRDERVVHETIRAVGAEVKSILLSGTSEDPVWVSTNGDGVAWLHVRIDERPKYYAYAPYRKFLEEGYDEAVNKETRSKLSNF